MATPADNAVKTIDDLLHQALAQGASDVHFESGEDFFRIRLRIDGLLRVAATPVLTLRDAIVSRLKVLARMDIAEKRVPQDGRIQYPYLDQLIDLRVSSLPTLHGEKIVVRILNFSRERPGLAAWLRARRSRQTRKSLGATARLNSHDRAHGLWKNFVALQLP